ncbi:hypothetical protein [Aurantiacibacter gilvus]|uniref:Uncharacterized protein n=1 Tax=Aurantiacibacter gilvus TaxID=3139141 RepID=A0ABU9IGY7_9SPHN
MSRRLALFFPALLVPAPVQAQHEPPPAYGPADRATETDPDADVPLVEAEPCEEEIREDGAIVVCRELPDTERYMSPLPKPVESDRTVIPGLTEPPCWIQPRGGICVRFGSVPEYPPIIDLSAFPEPLSEEEAAAVSAVDNEREAQALTGERVPIDLSEDD